jgi:molybdopterin-guanine dinucleotide biosynthesis protein A
MGRDKSLIEVDGVAMAARVAASLHDAGCSRVLVIGGDQQALTALGLDARPDDEPGEGPLGGIRTALRLATDDVVAVLACDLVAPSAGAVRTVVAACVESRGPAAVAVVDGQEQWLLAAWHRSARAVLDRAFADGVRSVRDAAAGLAGLRRVIVPAAAAADADTPDQVPGSDR